MRKLVIFWILLYINLSPACSIFITICIIQIVSILLIWFAFNFLQVQKLYTDLKQLYNGKKEDEEIWELAVEGENRGRLYGFGKRSRTSKSTRVLETVEAEPSNPTKSTATSASDANRKYSKDEVVDLLAAERARFASEIVAQEKRHKTEMEELFNRRHEYHSKCFDIIFKVTGAVPPPPYNVSTFFFLWSWLAYMSIFQPLVFDWQGWTTEGGNSVAGQSGGRVDDQQPSKGNSGGGEHTVN